MVAMPIETDRDCDKVDEDEPRETSEEGRRLISSSSTTRGDISS
jgi:hypothetical protein